MNVDPLNRTVQQEQIDQSALFFYEQTGRKGDEMVWNDFACVKVCEAVPSMCYSPLPGCVPRLTSR